MATTTRRPRTAVEPSKRRPGRRVVLIALGAVLAVAAITVVIVSNAGGGQPAAAPPAQVTYRPLAGAGSDTTQAVTDALSKSIPELASYPVRPAGKVTTKAPADNPDCTLDRPGGDVRGIEQLIISQELARQAGTRPCVDFARSTVNSAGLPGLYDAGLTYVPFARDAVTFAQRADSARPRSLTRAQLAAVFSCSAPDQATYRPLLPPYGSGLRTTFLTMIGLTDVPAFVQIRPCVTETGDVAGHSENVGLALGDPRDIAPYSVAQYLAQIDHLADGVHGDAVLGVVDGVAPVSAGSAVVGVVHRADYALGRVPADQLSALYTCSAKPTLQPAVRPMLPPPGSAVRAAFLTAIGVPDAPNFTTVHPCVGELARENDGTELADARQIAPYAVQAYLAQTYGTSADRHGTAILGPATGRARVLTLNPAFPLMHDVYNVVPTKRLAEPPTSTVFVGPSSAVCAATAIISAFGFATTPKCGDTSIHTPT